MPRPHLLLLCVAFAAAPIETAAAPGEELPQPAVTQEQTDEQAEEKLILFVMVDYLGHGKANHESDPRIYADRVSYFDRGEISRDAVIADQQSFYRRWPVRSYEYIADTLKIGASNDYSVEVTFRYNFELGNGKRTKRGVGVAKLGVAEADGRFVIVRESGSVKGRK